MSPRAMPVLLITLAGTLASLAPVAGLDPSDPDPGTQVIDADNVPSLSLDPNYTVLGVSGYGRLFPVFDSDGAGPEWWEYPDPQNATWSSSDPSVVLIGPKGAMLARKPGTVTITANYNGTTGTAQVKVAGRTLPGSVSTPDGRTRTWVLYEPASYQPGSPTPLVFAIHGGAGNSQGTIDMLQIHRVADRHGFLVASPNGTGSIPPYYTWNGGNCCGYAMSNGVDDVRFYRMMLAEIAKSHTVDPRRVFATGMSNGGIMSHRLACDAADIVAAVAPVAGQLNIGGDLFACRPGRPYSMMMFHGKHDANYPWNGGVGNKSVSNTSFHSVRSTLSDWLNHSAIPSSTRKETYRNGIAICDSYSNATSATDVALCRLEPSRYVQIGDVIYDGGGHSWPGGSRVGYQGSDVPTRDIDASEEMWKFFERHPMPSPPPAPKVLTTTPADGEKHVPLVSSVVIGFDQPMERNSTVGAFEIVPLGIGQLAPEILDRNLTWTPNATLKANTTYAVTLRATARSIAGVRLGSDFSFAFTTIASPPPLAPRVQETFPENGTTGVPLDQTFTVTFDTDMDAASAIASVSISPDAGSAGPWYFYRVLTWNQSALSPDTKYTVTIAASARSTAGLEMESSFTFGFTTAAAAPPADPVPPLRLPTPAILVSAIAICSLAGLLAIRRRRRRRGTGPASSPERPAALDR